MSVGLCSCIHFSIPDIVIDHIECIVVHDIDHIVIDHIMIDCIVIDNVDHIVIDHMF